MVVEMYGVILVVFYNREYGVCCSKYVWVSPKI